jgi:hypothetical protein
LVGARFAIIDTFTCKGNKARRVRKQSRLLVFLAESESTVHHGASERGRAESKEAKQQPPKLQHRTNHTQALRRYPGTR